MEMRAPVSSRLLGGFNRTASEQVAESLLQALRVLDLVPSGASQLTPHPLVVVRSEIENARRYLALLGDVTKHPGAELA